MAKVPVSLEDLKGLAALAQRNGTTDAFIGLALEWAASAAAEVVRLRKALNHIATSTGSDDPCQRFVEMARKALGDNT